MYFTKVKRNSLYLYYLLFILLSFIIYNFLLHSPAIYFSSNSDNAYYVIAGKDIFDGNYLLKGWFGSTNSFYLLCLIYGVLGYFFGYNSNLIVICEALCYSGIISVTVYFVLNLNKNKLIPLLLLFYLVISSYLFNKILFHGGTHNDSLIFSSLFLWIICKDNFIDYANHHKVKLFLSFLGILLSIVSDSLVLYFIVFPVMVVFIIKLLGNYKDSSIKKNCFFVSCILIFLLILAIIVSKFLFNKFGINVNFRSTDIKFIDFLSLGQHFAFYIEQIFFLFNSDISNLSPTGIQLIKFLQFSFTSAIFILLFLSVFKGKILNKTFNQVCFSIIIFQFLFVLFSGYLNLGDTNIKTMIDINSKRMIFTWFAFVILICQIDFTFFYKKIRYTFKTILPYKKSAFLFAFLLIIITFLGGFYTVKFNYSYKNYSRPIEFYKNIYKDYYLPQIYLDNIKIKYLSDYLKKNELYFGYGDFWLSNSIKVSSEYKVNIEALDDYSLERYDWLSKKCDPLVSSFKGGCSNNPRNYVLFCTINKALVNKIFGVPTKEIQIIEGVLLYIYDKELSISTH